MQGHLRGGLANCQTVEKIFPYATHAVAHAVRAEHGVNSPDYRLKSINIISQWPRTGPGPNTGVCSECVVTSAFTLILTRNAYSAQFKT